MGTYEKKLIALFGSMIVLLVVVIIISVDLFNDIEKNDEVYYVPGTTNSVEVADNNYPVVSTTVADTTSSGNEATTHQTVQQPSQQNNSGVTVTQAPTTATPAVNTSAMSDSEILQLLADAVNKTKAYSGAVTVHHSESFTADVTECTGGSLVASVANAIVGMVLNPTDETLSFSGGRATNSEGESVSILLPQKGSFGLTMSGISSISASSTQNGTEISIKLVPESVGLYDIPTANASSIGYLDIASLDISILEVTSSDIQYSGSTIYAVINSDGYVEYAKYTIPMHVEASAKSGAISGSAVFDGMQTEIWDFNW